MKQPDSGYSKSFFESVVAKRVRPPMPPLAVRVQVAERQERECRFTNGGPLDWSYVVVILTGNLTKRLAYLLNKLFGDLPRALDHDPALVLRAYNPRIKDVAARYTPHAHDPEALIYREKADHQQKTTGRKPGAERTVTTLGSDIHLKSKFARLEGKTKPKRKVPFKSRSFAKGPKRKISSRGFL